MSDTNSIPSFGAMIRKALGEALAPECDDNFLSMCADDIVFEFPFTPPGAVSKVSGLDTLTSYLSTVGGLLAFDSLSEATVHPSKDGETFVLEFQCRGSSKVAEASYDQTYISVVRLKDGKIVNYRDYWNPLVLLEAVGGIETLTSSLKDFIDE